MEDTARTSRLPGAQLQAAREQAGISEAEMAARLHLSVSYVRALEADNYDKLPEPTFVRGYIKNYARELGLPADDLANLYSELHAPERETTVSPVKVLPAYPQQQKLWLAVAVVVLFLLALLGWLASDSSPKRDLPEAAIPSVETVEPTVLDEEQETLPEAPSPATNAVDVEVVAEESEPLAAVDDLLELRFEQACWIRIRDADGTEIYAGQRPADSVFRQPGKAPFRITFGDAAAVSAILLNNVAAATPVAQPGKVLTIRVP